MASRSSCQERRTRSPPRCRRCDPPVFKKSSNITSIDGLKGKSVVSIAGTTNIKQLTEANAARNLGANIIPAKDHAEA
jgi:ABC-type amino acid transport substrate-binding protein